MRKYIKMRYFTQRGFNILHQLLSGLNTATTHIINAIDIFPKYWTLKTHLGRWSTKVQRQLVPYKTTVSWTSQHAEGTKTYTNLPVTGGRFPPLWCATLSLQRKMSNVKCNFNKFRAVLPRADWKLNLPRLGEQFHEDLPAQQHATLTLFTWTSQPHKT